MGRKFSTKDEEEDEADEKYHCASLRTGGWWFKGCQRSNLTGPCAQCDLEARAANIMWWVWACDWESSLNFTEMKIKPFYN